MKSTGIVRKIDELGRVVIPKEIRRTQNWEEGTSMEFLLGDGGLLIRKYQPMVPRQEELVLELDYLIRGELDPAKKQVLNQAITFIKGI